MKPSALFALVSLFALNVAASSALNKRQDSAAPSETEIAATRTISVQEASGLAKAQAENPNALPDDANTQSILSQIQGWVDNMGSGSSGSSDSTTNSDNCAQTFVPTSGMTCISVEEQFGLESGSLIKLNSPRINDECTNMIAGDTYCVKAA